MGTISQPRDDVFNPLEPTALRQSAFVTRVSQGSAPAQGSAHSSPPSASSLNPAVLNQFQLLGSKIVPRQRFELFLSSFILTCLGHSRAVRAAGHRHFGLICYTRKTSLLAANSLTLLLPALGCLGNQKALGEKDRGTRV